MKNDAVLAELIKQLSERQGIDFNPPADENGEPSHYSTLYNLFSESQLGPLRPQCYPPVFDYLS